MKARLQAWWQARNKRERVLVWLALLALPMLLVELILFAPQRDEQTRLRRELAAAEAQIEQLGKTAAHTAAANSIQARRTQLAGRRARAEEIVHAAQRDLIAPHEMGKQLSAILTRFPSLRVVGMTATGPKPLMEAMQPTNGAIANTTESGTPAATSTVTLYQHGIELSVEGRYLDLLAYLDALDRAPYRIYWRELDLTMGAQGVPVTRLTLFTLSKEAVWLRL